MRDYDVIVVGGGPAGFTAALYTSRGRLDTLLVERAFSGGQMAVTNEMENYPGFEEPISGTELAHRMEKQAKRFGTAVVTGDVTGLELEEDMKTVKTTAGIFRAKAVILCMGASPKKLEIPGEKKFTGSGLSYCATCDGAFFKGMKVAVIGGGDTAAEDVLFLTRFCEKVYLIHRRDRLRATKVLQEAVFINKKIEVIWDTTVEEITGDFGVTAIRLKNLKSGGGFDLAVEGVFVAIGNIPNTKLVTGKINTCDYGYIITDENMQTNIPGVYAAGDIREKPLRQVITAASDGAVAAYTAERYISEKVW